jgi:FlaA1/EpsC-like NDP-sugar epimerase/lipopolysaccharide/colanic/teichoic acid biosynthesis glycosyltransferase
MLKRIIDILLALIGLLLLCPLFCIISFWIQFDSPGSIFFRQTRIGRFGKEFRIYKFRTMVSEAEKLGKQITVGNDARITQSGKLLRRYKLDELPQLLNVLNGDMSLVGPRPEVPKYVAMYTQKQREVLQVRPGITDPASIAFSNENEILANVSDPELTYIQDIMPRKLAMNLEYVNRPNLIADLKIIFQTLIKISSINTAMIKKFLKFPDVGNRHLFWADALISLFVPLLALEIRLDGDIFTELGDPNRYIQTIIIVTIAFLIIKLSTLHLFGFYKHFWRYASIDELVKLAAWAIAVITIESGLVYIETITNLTPYNLPRSLPILDGLLSFILIGGLRLSKRSVERLEYRSRRNQGDRTLIIGAGHSGITLVQEMQGNPALGFSPVAFIDDAQEKRGLRIRGIPIVGDRQDIPGILESLAIQRVVIAMPTAPGSVIREVSEVCRKMGIQTSTIPGTREILSNRVSAKNIRDIQIEDLLKRDPISTDLRQVNALLQGKRVLITGAGGSIGSELCRQILRSRPAAMLLVGKGENSIFHIQQELEQLILHLKDDHESDGYSPELITFIADIRSTDRLDYIFAQTRPDVVFHAAAHKHVPLMELNVSEAISSNVIGTKNLLDVAQRYHVSNFVMISTDKAVNPTNVMGASKRVAEMLVLQAAKTTGQAYDVVRFGNVLGSRGSVVPTFQRQIRAGGPVKITHPDICRYFMTIPEAVQLTLQAAVLSIGGKIMMLDMGKPIKIINLAQDLIRLSGYEVGKDIQIVCTGLRPGEKLFEELFIEGEEYERTKHEKIMIVQNASQQISTNLESLFYSLTDAALKNNTDLVIVLLEQLVAGYKPNRTSPMIMKSGPTIYSQTAIVQGNPIANQTLNHSFTTM